MSLPIITADQRLAERRGIKAVIFGKSGIGKTYLLLTLDEGSTLYGVNRSDGEVFSVNLSTPAAPGLPQLIATLSSAGKGEVVFFYNELKHFPEGRIMW
mgnify:CR=1 FL=1